MSLPSWSWISIHSLTPNARCVQFSGLEKLALRSNYISFQRKQRRRAFSLAEFKFESKTREIAVNLHFRARGREKDCFLCRWRRWGCVKRALGVNVCRAESCTTDNGKKSSNWEHDGNKTRDILFHESDVRLASFIPVAVNDDDSSTRHSMNFSSSFPFEHDGRR